ncbi:MAG: ATP-binding protein [Acidobacteriota bacterium]
MAKLDVQKARDLLQGFDFGKLFVEELGWSQPVSHQSISFVFKGDEFKRKQIAQLSGVAVLEVTSSDGRIPDRKTLAAIHKEISKLHHENLVIFVDAQRSQSLWYWVKREDKKVFPREHLYIRGQPVDLLLSKITAMVFDVTEFDEAGNVSVVEVANRLKQALDVERVTKKFYSEFYDQHLAFIEHIKGIDDEHDRRWYASVLLNRLMLIYFLQSKGFIKGHSDDADFKYLRNELSRSRERGKDRYYHEFLNELFFEGFAKAQEDRTDSANELIGGVPYLNGGLFLKHGIELRWLKIAIADKAFDNLFRLFESYSWNLDDTPGGQADEINPDVLGYIFEKYINQKAFGAYYTRTEITQYLCEQTIYKLILDRVNGSPSARGSSVVKLSRRFDSMSELLLNLDDALCRFLLDEVLPDLKLLDPACGSGAFLVAAMKTLINVYSGIIGKVEFTGNQDLKRRLDELRVEHHGSLNYYIKREIITNNLFGVDLMEDATEIAKLRLFLALVASAKTVDQLEPLPNIDFNIIAGNSLIGILKVDAAGFDKLETGQQGNLLGDLAALTYAQILKDKNESVTLYKKHAQLKEPQEGLLDQDERLLQLREHIDKLRHDSSLKLNQLLIGDFQDLGIKFEEATWDEKKKKEGKTKKRPVEIKDIEALRPFHWGFEFDEVINQKGGFDAILTNPPWEIFKPNSKEFFQEFSDLVTKKKMTIHEFEKAQAKLLRDPELQQAWLEYLSSYPHVSAYFRSAAQYKNQISIVNGKKAGSDINLYKLFTEQCFNLLRKGGYCGIVIPSGIYTDLGTKQLREMLFTQGEITGLFCFENRKEIFEGVHRSYKFLVLTFEKGGVTKAFPAAFMRLDASELQGFPQYGAINISVELIRRLSPDSLSVMEFKSQLDILIAEKMLKFPPLGKEIADAWNLRLTREFDMTNDSHLFETQSAKGRLRLYEGKMIHQFTHELASSRYWIGEKKGRSALLKRGESDKGQELDYQRYRLGFRDVARNTDERTMISTVIPNNVFAGNTLITSTSPCDTRELLAVSSLLNSFAFDSFIRQKVSAHCNMFYVYQVPVPRLAKKDPFFLPLVERAAKLICTTSEFDDLAREGGLVDHKDGVTDPAVRARLRAELDGMIAHIYGLTEEEFTHILSTFPLVEQSVKDAALEAYREFSPKPGDQEIAALIAKGESATLEFKSSARWDMKQSKADKIIEGIVVKTVAALLNSEGGALLLGVDDDRNVIGLAHDYKLFGKKDSRDAYENFLTTLLLQNLGKDSSTHISITFHELDGKDIAKVAVKPSPKPVYDKDGLLYIRAGNSTRPLNPKETVDYCKMHWT